MVLGVFSTFSRGAFIGLSVFMISFWKNSDKKLFWLAIIIIIISAAAYFMPDTWLTRMNTLENVSEDGSFMGRVIAWKIAILIAMDNFFGGGFKAVENISVWHYYASFFYKLDFIPTASAYPYFKATHSIYFQVLSNHGFFGLFLFLMVLITAFFKISKVNKLARKYQLDDWVIMLTKMLKLSLLSFVVSGAAVNVAYFDFLYVIFAMVVGLELRIAGQIEGFDKVKKESKLQGI